MLRNLGLQTIFMFFIPSCWTVGAEWGGVFNFGTVRLLDE